MASELRVNTIKGAVGINTINVESSLSLSQKPFIEMAQTITENYSISSGNNALTAGPVTIGIGITVIVPSGSNWTVV
jgi:hypothetical protein